jgi:cellulose synthase/poly-beta-1,6-N-acetylglucosamine synthase-like glycosyltransferase
MNIITTTIAWLIIIFGAVNLVRIMFFMIGSDIYMLKQDFAKKSKKPFAASKLPVFSVVIPAHNESYTILRSVGSVIESDYPKNKLEITVVDDGSTDDTVKILKNYLKKIDATSRVTIVSQSNAGKAHALNNAIKNFSTGELVMCLDADSSLEPDALLNAAEYFRDPTVAALAANVKIRPTGTLFNLIQRFEYIICYQMKRAQTVFNVEYIVGGIGSTFRRSALEAVNYYDTNTITEDIDLTMKLLSLGSKTNRAIYGSNVITYTESVLSVAGLIKQRYRWKYGRSQTFFKHPQMFFATDKKHGKLLTWLYLPFAIFSDIAFFFEPFLIAFIFYVVIRYHDITTLLSAIAVISIYIIFNVLAENTISWKDKIILTLIAPSMYVFFYLLSFVEYVALIKGMANLRNIKKSIDQNICGWQHVERSAT